MYSAPRVYRALRLAVREVDLLPVLTISRIFSVLTPGGPGTPFLHLFSGSLLRGGRFHGNNDTVTLVLGCPSPPTLMLLGAGLKGNSYPASASKPSGSSPHPAPSFPVSSQDKPFPEKFWIIYL